MLDDRPIQPDQKYLNDYLEKINKIETKQYLKKRSQPFLPCQLHNVVSKDQKNVKKHSSKSKAQIYEEIKKRNLQKFGDKKVEEPIIEQPKKKMNPDKITVGYKPKQVIQTQEYKKKDYVPKARTTVNQPDKQKIQYEKLIDYFKQELDGLEKEKQQFSKVAQKLKFKEMIKKEDGLLFTQIKSEVEKKFILSNFSHSKENSSAQENRLTQARSRDKQFEVIQQIPEKKKGDKFSKTFSAEEIRSCMEKTSQKLQQIKTQLLQRDLTVNQHRYDVSQIHLLPSFDPQHLYDYLDPNKIKYNGNDNYKAALNAFNAKFKREKMSEDNICDEVENMEEGNSNIRVKFVGQKRVMKYEGWTEVWIPGRQRLMANKEGYKVVWLKNGDVLQEFGNNTKSYYCLAKDMHKIQFREDLPCYYHNGLGQIWRQGAEGEKEVVFKNGRKEIISAK